MTQPEELSSAAAATAGATQRLYHAAGEAGPAGAWEALPLIAQAAVSLAHCAQALAITDDTDEMGWLHRHLPGPYAPDGIVLDAASDLAAAARSATVEDSGLVQLAWPGRRKLPGPFQPPPAPGALSAAHDAQQAAARLESLATRYLAGRPLHVHPLRGDGAPLDVVPSLTTALNNLAWCAINALPARPRLEYHSRHGVESFARQLWQVAGQLQVAGAALGAPAAITQPVIQPGGRPRPRAALSPTGTSAAPAARRNWRARRAPGAGRAAAR
jgi:hypothetical protein